MELEDWNDNVAVVSSFQAQDIDFKEDELMIGLKTSEISVAATISFNTDWKPIYDPIPVSQDQVGTVSISLVSNTLDPLVFSNVLK
jgi:hypothetical protein